MKVASLILYGVVYRPNVVNTYSFFSKILSSLTEMSKYLNLITQFRLKCSLNYSLQSVESNSNVQVNDRLDQALASRDLKHILTVHLSPSFTLLDKLVGSIRIFSLYARDRTNFQGFVVHCVSCIIFLVSWTRKHKRSMNSWVVNWKIGFSIAAELGKPYSIMEET